MHGLESGRQLVERAYAPLALRCVCSLETKRAGPIAHDRTYRKVRVGGKDEFVAVQTAARIPSLEAKCSRICGEYWMTLFL